MDDLRFPHFRKPSSITRSYTECVPGCWLLFDHVWFSHWVGCTFSFLSSHSLWSHRLYPVLYGLSSHYQCILHIELRISGKIPQSCARFHTFSYHFFGMLSSLWMLHVDPYIIHISSVLIEPPRFQDGKQQDKTWQNRSSWVCWGSSEGWFFNMEFNYVGTCWNMGIKMIGSQNQAGGLKYLEIQCWS